MQVSEPQGKSMQMCFICWNERPGLLTRRGSAVSLWISSAGSVPLYVSIHSLREAAATQFSALIWDESDMSPTCNKYSQTKARIIIPHLWRRNRGTKWLLQVSDIAGQKTQLAPHLLPGALKLAKATLLFNMDNLLNVLLLFLCLVRPVISFLTFHF